MRLERWILIIPLRLRSLFRREDVDRELDEELAFHLDQRTQEFVSRGLDPKEARRARARLRTSPRSRNAP